MFASPSHGAGSREVARPELTGLVRLELLCLIGREPRARYAPLSFGVTLVSDAAEWAIPPVRAMNSMNRRDLISRLRRRHPPRTAESLVLV